VARRKLNKSARIREALETMGADASPKAVVEALAAKKIKVALAAVSNIKAKLAAPNGARNSKASNGALTLKSLMEAKKLVDRIGLEGATAAINALSKLR
jgi:hypothetical protein